MTLLQLAVETGSANSTVVDAAFIAAIGAAGAGLIAALTALIKTLREPTSADLLARVQTLERRFTGLVRFYHAERVRALAEGYELAPLPEELLQ